MAIIKDYKLFNGREKEGNRNGDKREFRENFYPKSFH